MKSRLALERAIMTLAERTPLLEITLSDLANEAGVSRATVYNHATTPFDLARDVILAQLERQRVDFERSFDSGSRRAAYTTGLRILADHLVANETLYRTERNGEFGNPIMDLLTEFATTATQELLQRHSEVLPASTSPTMVPVLAASIAHGAVRAIDAWLQLPDRDEHELVTHMVLTLPHWLLD